MRTSSDRRLPLDRWLIALASRRVLHIALLSLAYLVLFAAFALINPLGSGPDESAHYIYSAAVARGESGTLDVDVPAAVSNITQLTCIAYQPDLTAACQTLYSGAATTVEAQTHVGLYNPVFYAWTGIGSLIAPTEGGLYIARLLAGLVGAVLAGWGTSLLVRQSRSPWPVAGLLLVLTPMVAYVNGVLNPSGWEIVSALSFTVSAYVVIVRNTAGRWTESHTLLVVSGAILLPSRGLSPFIAVLIVAALVIVAGWARVREVMRRAQTWWAFGILALVGVVSIAWILLHGTNYVGVNPPSSLRQGIASIPTYYQGLWLQVQQVFGYTGWLDQPPPNLVVILWFVVLVGFVVVSYVIVRPRHQLVIALSAAAVLLIPGVLAGLQWGGVGWQGRYTLPMIVGLVVIAGLCAVDSRRDSLDRTVVLDGDVVRRTVRQTTLAAVVLFVVSMVAVAAITAHRYMVGEAGSLLAEPTWNPPVPAILLLALIAVSSVLLAWSTSRTAALSGRAS